ncbi:MAG: ARPP-1 family domain-containing protein [Planctomycetota bacterium]|jgi:hypothetical protein
MRTLILTLALCVVARADDSYIKDFVAGVRMGTPLQGELAILIPLIADSAPDTGVTGQLAAEGLKFAEPSVSSHQYAVECTNTTDKPVLVGGGTVLVGGKRDRMLRYDTIVAPGATIELRAFPASTEVRREAQPFTMAKSAAPVYLRKKADFGGSSGQVINFIMKNLEFRDEGDKEKSLASIGKGKILQGFAQEGRAKLKAKLSENPPKGKVVGAIFALRGRVQSIMIFGSPSTLKDYKGSYILGATYTAAAIALQARKKNLKLPGLDDPEGTLKLVMEDAAKLMENLRKATYKKDKSYPGDATGERYIVRLYAGARGRAIAADGKLVRLAVFPNDPVESAIYGSTIKFPDQAKPAEGGGDGGDEYVSSTWGMVGLSRVAANPSRRLTVAERRFVGGMRGGGGARGGGGRGGGGRR